MELSREHFFPKMAKIKDRKDRDLVDTEEIKKRWQEYTEELYRKDLNDLDDHDGMSPRARHHGV